MLEQLLQDLLAQSGLGGFAPLLTPVIHTLKGVGLNKITGTSGNFFSASDFLSPGSSQRLIQNKFRALEYNRMFGAFAEEQNEAFGRRTAENLFRSFGYSEGKAKIAAGTGLGSTLAGIAEFMSPMSTGTTAIASALFGRRNYMTVDGGAYESAVSAAHSGRRILKDITEAYNNREFGRLSFDEVGSLASQIINTGIIDKAFADSAEYAQVVGSDSGAKTDTRAERLRSKIKSYSRSIDKLKDVIDGDVSKVLDSMDKLFGGTTIAMSAAKLEKITSSMQHAALVTGADAQTIAQNAGLGYTYIADVGGTQGMGVRIGIETAYLTAGASSDSRVSRDELRSGAAMALSNITRSRESKNFATAYVAWKNTQPENADKSVNAFIKTLGGNLTNEAFVDSAFNSLSKQYNTTDRSKLGLLYVQLSDSEEVLDVEETENVRSTILDNKIDKLKTKKINMLRRIYERNPKAFVSKDAETFIKDITAGDWTLGTEAMIQRLEKYRDRGADNSAGAYSDAVADIREYAGEVQRDLGVQNNRVGQELIRKNEQARKLRAQQLYYDKLTPEIRSIIAKGRVSGGFSSMLDNINKTDHNKAMTIRAALSLLAGVDIDQVDAMTEPDKKAILDKMEKSVTRIAPGRGSSLTGIRKVKTDEKGVQIETAEQAEKLDTNYAVQRLGAENTIKKVAEGEKLTEGDRAALSAWLSNTEMSDSQRAVYMSILDGTKSNADAVRQAAKYTAEELSSGEARRKKAVFDEATRLEDIAKSYLGDRFREHGAEFVSTVRNATRAMTKARRQYGAEIDQAAGMNEAQRKEYAKKGAKEAAAVQALTDAEKTVDVLKKHGNEVSKEVLSFVQGSGTSVESLLQSVIRLLTSIDGKTK